MCFFLLEYNLSDEKDANVFLHSEIFFFVYFVLNSSRLINVTCYHVSFFELIHS